MPSDRRVTETATSWTSTPRGSTPQSCRASRAAGPGLTQTKSELGTEDKPWRFATGIGEGMAISNNLEKDRAAV